MSRSLSRRAFLQGSLIAAGGLALPRSAFAESVTDSESYLEQSFAREASRALNSPTPYNIIQGPTNETQAQIAIDLPKSLNVTYEVREVFSGRRLEVQNYRTSERSYANWRVDQIRIDGLRLGEEYVLQVKDDRGRLRDERAFGALDTQRTDARVALLSCMFDMSTAKAGMWDSFNKADPDAVFLLGDNVYGDLFSLFHSPKIIWHRYMSSRLVIPFYRRRRLIPSFAIWDDHDFGSNNADGRYPHKDHSLDVFESFYAQIEIPGFYRRGPGISSSVDLFGFRVILLDGRYFRGLDTPQGTAFIGAQQLQWMEDQIQTSNLPVWICMGSQFFGRGDHRDESYEYDAPVEFAQFLQILSAANRPPLLASGDVHFSEVMEIHREEAGFHAHEITSSSMHSFPAFRLPPNKRRVEGALYENFQMVDLALGEGGVDVTCVGNGARTRYSRRLILE